MALKWDPLKIHNGLDLLEEMARALQPALAPLLEKARKMKETKDLPQYMTQSLSGLVLELNNVPDRLFREIDSARSAIPPVERLPATKRKFSLITGRQYEVRQGGARLHWMEKVVGNYSYNRAGQQRLHVGDVITYVGREPGDTYLENHVFEARNAEVKKGQLDIFQIGKAKGAYLPVNGDNRAAKRFFRPVK